MKNHERLTVDSLDTLRTALVAGDVSLSEIEYVLQKRMDGELSKPAHEVDGELVERIEKMLQIPHRTRLNGGGGTLRSRSFEEIMEAVGQAYC